MAILVKSSTAQDEKDRWGTQWECFYDAEALTGYRFLLDACAEKPTSKCATFISRAENALVVDWVSKLNGVVERIAALQSIYPNNRPAAIWCNPPFTQKAAFLDVANKVAQRGVPVVCLVPYEPTTQWWRDCVRGKAARLYLPDGRYNFLKVDGVTKKKGVNFPSCFVEYTPGLSMNTIQIDFERGIHKQKRRLAA